jgi:polyhydroxyalkanoate synthesis repressor PhaR
MTNKTNDRDQVLELRKYPNRRYYDTTRSRHVTLEEIQAVVRDGHEVCVTDSRTGEDITAKVLTQIILELDSPKLSIFPVPLLHRLIRANEALVNDFVDKYFNQALASFLDSQRQFDQFLRQTLRLHPSTPSVADWTRLMLNPFGAAGKPQPSEKASEEEAPAGDLQEAVEELRQQVKAMRQELGKGKDKEPRKKSAKKRPAGDAT